jgi:hypothetical protein
MGEPDVTFQPIDPLRTILQRGWLVVAAGILGALVGLGLSRFLPARYESGAAIAISLDYGRTEPLELVVEDRALDRVWQLFTSDQTLQGALALLDDREGADPAWEDLEALREHTRLDARLSRWELIGIHRDPERAAAIASAWSEVALERLERAYAHAWNAVEIQGQPFDVNCLQLITGEPPEAIWECLALGPELTEAEIAALRREIEASHGVLPILQFEQVSTAQLPERPVARARGLLVLSGGGIGWVLGMMLALARGRGSVGKEEDPASAL